MDRVSPSAVLVALSGPFKQRGEAALLSPFVRAECALSAGADAVFALPVSRTLCGAEHYALGAVSFLASLGATHLAFGAESADLKLLQRTADLLEDPPAPLRAALHAALARGKGWPAALSEAAGLCLGESRALLCRPNNILAVCYLRAVRRLGAALTPVVIPRSGSYHADRPDPAAPSASALRDSLRRGNWQEALCCLPEPSAAAVRAAFLSGNVPDPARLDTLLIGKLRGMTPEEAARLPDCSEGLDRALLKAAERASSREELITMLTGRRYSSARISRLCACALLGITRSSLEQAAPPSAALLLGIRKNPSLTGSWKNSSVQLLTASKWQESADPADLAAWKLWGIAAGLPASWPFARRLMTDR